MIMFQTSNIIDPEFDDEPNRYPPTSPGLDHYQPHHRVGSSI